MNYIHHHILHFVVKPLIGHGQTINKLLKAVLPKISKQELKKILPIFSLFFLISFVYHILRCLKITLISGAEEIPFLKFWLVMPSAIAFTCFYVYLAKYPNRKILIYNMFGLFTTFFIKFMVFLYPNKEYLYLDTLANYLK